MHDEPDPLNDTSPRTTPANASRDRVVIDVADVEPATVPMPEVPYRSAIDAAIVATSFASLSASVRFPNALSEAPFDWGTSAIATKCDSPPGSSACAKMRRLCQFDPRSGGRSTTRPRSMRCAIIARRSSRSSNAKDRTAPSLAPPHGARRPVANAAAHGSTRTAATHQVDTATRRSSTFPIVESNVATIQFDRSRFTVGARHAVPLRARVATGPRAGQRVLRLDSDPTAPPVTTGGPRPARSEGFDLHANAAVRAGETERLEQARARIRSARPVTTP